MLLRKSLPGFSLVEIVLGLLILSLMVSISITNFEGKTEDIKKQAAAEQLQTIQNGLTRWQLENNRAYPYEDLEALKGKYVDRVDADPWGHGFRVIPKQGIVYSLGPDGVDSDGSGDDIQMRFSITTASPPQPPSKLAAKPSASSSNTVDLAWIAPLKNVDGSPITTPPGAQWKYEIYEAKNATNFTTQPRDVVLFGTNRWSAPGLSAKTNYYYRVRLVRTLAGADPLMSAYSNTAGMFVPASTVPEIRRFTASSQKVPINSPFSLDVDVFDPAANLQEVKVTFNSKTTDLLSSGGNNFHILRTFIPPDVPKVPVPVTDGSITVKGGVPVTSVTKPLPKIEFVNNRPVITSLRPGVLTFTAAPSKKVTVDFTVEARDDDKNLEKITLTDGAGHAADFPPNNGKYQNTQFAVERISWEYDLGTTRTVYVTATATDSLGLASLPSNAQIAIAADITPPETPVVNLNPSNACIATDDKVFAWSIRESRRVTIHADSYDAESPPVQFRALISTVAPTNPTSFEANAVTQTKDGARVKGWTTPVTTNEFTLIYDPSGAGDLASELKEGTYYWVGVKALNSSAPTPLENKSVIQPKNPKTGYPQNPFVVDLTPPRITFVGIDNPGFGFVCGGVTLTGRWRAEDLTKDGAKDGSGPYRYRYQIFERLATETQNVTNIGRVIFDQENESTELRFALPVEAKVSPNKYHMARYTLAVSVRDTSCRWSNTTSTAVIVEDQTPPQLTFITTAPAGQPQVVAPAGTLNDPNTFEGSWANVLIDPDEAPSIPGTDGIKSYEWGVSHRCDTALPFPDIFPGDGSWRFAGTSLGDRAIRANMLTNGDFVFLTLRAYNWAGCASSIVTCSKAILVDTSLQVNLKASSSLFYVCPQHQDVSFQGSVTGGGPDFIYKSLQPRSDPTDPDNRTSVDKTLARTVTYDNPAITYTTKDVGRRTATLEVESYVSDTAPAPNLARRADAPVICRCQPYVLSLNAGDAGNPASVSVIDLARTTSANVAQVNFPSGEKPTDMVVDPARYATDSTKVGARWALITSNTAGGNARVYRFAVEGDSGGGLRLEETFLRNGEQFQSIDVSRDGTVAYIGVNIIATGARKYYRLSLQDGRVTAGGVLPIPNDTGSAGIQAGVRLARSGQFGIGLRSDASKIVEKILTPEDTPTLNNGIYDALTDNMTPDLIDISPDDKIGAVSSSASGSLKVGFTDLTRASGNARTGFAGTNIPGETFGVRFDPLIATHVYFTMTDRALAFTLGNDPNKVDSTKVLPSALALTDDSNNPVADPQLRGLDLPFDGSYLVVAAQALDKVLILQADARSGVNPFQGGVNTFGAALQFTGQSKPGFKVGKRPIRVQVAERLAFGQPVIRFLSATTISPGGTLVIYGSNLTPVLAPFNGLVVTVGGKKATISTDPTKSDNLASITVTLDPTTPLGTQDVIVTNTTIDATDLRDSVPVRINVQ